MQTIPAVELMTKMYFSEENQIHKNLKSGLRNLKNVLKEEKLSEI